MDEIRFALRNGVEIFINSHSLRDLAREVEAPYAEAEGNPELPFRQGHRDDWDLGALGPFRFERAQYEDAVAGAVR